MTSDGFADPDAFHRQGPFRIDGEIRQQEGTLSRAFLQRHRLGVRALRAASDLLSHPRARWFHRHRPGYESACCCQPDHPHLATPASPSAPPSFQFLGGRRIQRLGLDPRSRLRRPFDRPGLVTGESASMGPTVFACRLLQLQNTTYEHDPRAMVPAA
jgi:hypothetical protein